MVTLEPILHLGVILTDQPRGGRGAAPGADSPSRIRGDLPYTNALMIPRPDLLDPGSPRGLQVFQLTEGAVPWSHIYMEAQIFTPDSRRLVIQRSATAHGGDIRDPEHRYYLCEVQTGELIPLTDETGAVAPSVSPDGEFLYYFVDQTQVGVGGALSLRRRRIDGSQAETIVVIDSPLPGSGFRPSRAYPLSTISSDGQRIALAVFLGDGESAASPFGLLVFDIAQATVRLILHGPSWCNLHPQYSRSSDPQHARDILIQENHGNVCSAGGEVSRLVRGLGADIHVIRDDGMNFRDLPFGRDETEKCQGHQCWRGRSAWAITSTYSARSPDCRLIEGRAVEHADHDGLRTPGAAEARNDLAREFPQPSFYHFATDIRGTRVISDTGPMNAQARIYLAGLGAAGQPLLRPTYLLSPKSSWAKHAHIHPFLSPDGNTAFFNSDESGVLQTYMLRNLPDISGREPDEGLA